MKKYLKKVIENDCEILFLWANDEQVRESSFNSKKITFEEHVEWFKTRLLLIDCYMYIFYKDEMPIGQVRIEVENQAGTISYSIDKDYRGQGLALEMLQLLEQEIYKDNIKVKKLIGNVKSENLASQKIFQKLNYDELIENNNFKYYKYL